MQSILIATRNTHKTREIRQILGTGFELSDLTSHPGIPPALESGVTFEANARLKAIEASRHFDGLVLADDSGIEVDALDGAPGVYSARFAGENADDEQNRVRLLEELRRVKSRGRKRSARFRCVIALAQNGKCVATFDGVVEGVIVNKPKGGGGFGYDPLFVPDGYCETFAQLPAEVKNQLSHRGRALEKVRSFLGALS